MPATNGFFIDWDARTIHGTIGGQKRYELTLDAAVDRAWFRSERRRNRDPAERQRSAAWGHEREQAASTTLDMLPYLKLKLLLESVSDPRHVHFANVAGLQENHRDCEHQD